LLARGPQRFVADEDAGIQRAVGQRFPASTIRTLREYGLAGAASSFIVMGARII
jgi:hypothetical protein